MMLSHLVTDWYNKHINKQPWYEDREGGFVYNKAFINQLRAKLGAAPDLTDELLINVWKSREAYETEAPLLEVLHSGINDDGSLKLKLEWNDAFIRVLRNHGFNDEDEDVVIQRYLASIAREEAINDTTIEQASFKQAQPNPSPAELEQMLDNLPKDVIKDVEKILRRKAQQKGRAS